MPSLRHAARNLIRKVGFDLVRFPQPLHDPFKDMQCLLEDIASPTIFDVGANIGQSVGKFKRLLPHSVIHSFEPSPAIYRSLVRNCSTVSGLKIWNYGVGSISGMKPLFENVSSDMTSFLEPSQFAWGHVEKTTSVEMITLDEFSRANKIDYIHILKSDTQGYEYEVLDGAKHLMEQDRIGMIYMEIIFSDMYKNRKTFDEIFRLLCDRGFYLVTFYSSHFQRNLLSWTDALFINRKFYNQVSNRFPKTDGI